MMAATDDEPYLNAVMPNGKKLRDCSARECAQIGAGLMRIAERVSVGTLAEDDVAVRRRLIEQHLSAIYALLGIV
jgi:hypothetical protein